MRADPSRFCAKEAGLEATISIDTRKASVARKALEAGADWINDVSGGEFDPQMLTVAPRPQSCALQVDGEIQQ